VNLRFGASWYVYYLIFRFATIEGKPPAACGPQFFIWHTENIYWYVNKLGQIHIFSVAQFRYRHSVQIYKFLIHPQSNVLRSIFVGLFHLKQYWLIRTENLIGNIHYAVPSNSPSHLIHNKLIRTYIYPLCSKWLSSPKWHCLAIKNASVNVTTPSVSLLGRYGISSKQMHGDFLLFVTCFSVYFQSFSMHPTYLFASEACFHAITANIGEIEYLSHVSCICYTPVNVWWRGSRLFLS
jgi:hypothetical protein